MVIGIDTMPLVPGHIVYIGESLQAYFWIQDFEAVFPKKVSLKILNSGEYNSLSILFSECLKTVDHLNLKLLSFIVILQV